MYKDYKRIGVYGSGVSGRAVVEYFRGRYDFHLTLRSDKPGRNPVGADRVLFGEDALKNIDEQILFLSPTVRRERPELIEAMQRGVILSSDAELFFERNKAPVFAVTGSSGKSTATYLISEALRPTMNVSPPIGNFGSGLSSFTDKYEAFAAELSSFQLNYFAPITKRAVITNITPNHLDWHKDFEEYASAKMNIAKRCDGLIIDADCDELVSRVTLAGTSVLSAVSFGEKPCIKAENYLCAKEDAVYLNGKRYISLGGALRKERHNLKNFALVAAATLGYAPADDLEKVFSDFSGLAHRCELVAESGGIKFINSSIDTSPERALATLLSLRGKTVPIIMGKNKNLPLIPLAEALPEITVGAVLMGEIGEALYEMINAPDYQKELASNMDEALKRAVSILDGCGHIVLTPAGTSFDRYKNYAERGEDFRRAVNQLLSK